MKSRKAASVTLAIILLLIVATISVIAQRGTSIVSRTSFPRGRTTAVVSGTVQRGRKHQAGPNRCPKTEDQRLARILV